MNEVEHSSLPFKITKSDHDNNGAHFYIDSRVEQSATEAEFEADRAFLELAANSHYTLTEQRGELLAALKDLVAQLGTIQAFDNNAVYSMGYTDNHMGIVKEINRANVLIKKAEAKS